MADDEAGPRGRESRSRAAPPGLTAAVRPGNAADRLVRAIEGQIIPRLMLVHRVAVDPASPPRARSGRNPGPADIDALAALVLHQDAAAAVTFAEELLEQGARLEAIYLELLAPAARQLGALWDADRVDFMQVTLGLCRLQQVVHTLAPAFVGEGGAASPQRILLAALPGEQHTFGLTIVGDFFRRAGWDVWEPAGPARADALEPLRRESFAIAGLSVACDTRIPEAMAIIAAMRRASRNRDLAIMVGGQAFAGHPERVAQVGADATALDGRQATFQARALVGGDPAARS
jgi:methanogenic corrinoid protein MtbC1